MHCPDLPAAASRRAMDLSATEGRPSSTTAGGSDMTPVAHSLIFTAGLVGAVLCAGSARAEQPPPPCHPNPNAAADRAAVATRGDVVNLPGPLKDRLVRLADRPHSYLPMQVFAEARRDSSGPSNSNP